MKIWIWLLCLFLLPIQPIYAEKKITVYAGAVHYLKADDDVHINVQVDHPKIVKVVNGNTLIGQKKGQTKITVMIDEQSVRYHIQVKTYKFVPYKKLKDQSWMGSMNDQQAQKAYQSAKAIAMQALDVSREKTLKRLTILLRQYFDQNNRYAAKTKHSSDPYGFFIEHKVNCAGVSRTAGLCLNILGYRFEHVNVSSKDHQWARTKVGKSYYAIDPLTYICAKEPAVRSLPKDSDLNLDAEMLFAL